MGWQEKALAEASKNIKKQKWLVRKREEEFQKYFNYSAFFAIFSDSETKNLEFKKSYYHIDKLIEYVFKNLKPIKTMKELEAHYWFFKILLDFIEILKQKVDQEEDESLSYGKVASIAKALSDEAYESLDAIAYELQEVNCEIEDAFRL